MGRRVSVGAAVAVGGAAKTRFTRLSLDGGLPRLQLRKIPLRLRECITLKEIPRRCRMWCRMATIHEPDSVPDIVGEG